MKGRRIYLVTHVVPDEYSTPVAVINFKLARELVRVRGQIQEFNMTYKTSLNRIRQNGHVALYDKTKVGSDLEAQVTGYWSIEEIELCTSL